MSHHTPTLPRPRSRVLSTLNRDGSRRRIRPKVSKGRYYRRRFLTAWGLIAQLHPDPDPQDQRQTADALRHPQARVHLLRRDLPADRHLSADAAALQHLRRDLPGDRRLGRVWCGWACPQTVYMEFIYRPLEVLIEGGRSQPDQARQDRGRRCPPAAQVRRRSSSSRPSSPTPSSPTSSVGTGCSAG